MLPGTLFIFAALGILSPAFGADVDFRRDVWPILEARCVECHGPPRPDSSGAVKGPKAGLRLDGRGHILEGSETSDRVVVAGNPEQSLMHKLTALPPGDLDIMPSKGDPLTAEQVEILRRWIAEGAKFGDWKGSGGPARPRSRKREGVDLPQGPPSVTLEIWRSLGQGLDPVPPRALEGLCGGLARVEPVFPGSPLLRVSFTSHQGEVRDSHLKALKGIGRHVVNLDLGRTGVSDEGLRSLRALPRLVRLNLRGTKIGDEGLKVLRSFPELRSLILIETSVTDASIDTLSSISKLSDLYLWGTKITPVGMSQIQASRPATRVRGTPDFPEAEQEGARRRSRRR